MSDGGPMLQTVKRILARLAGHRSAATSGLELLGWAAIVWAAFLVSTALGLLAAGAVAIYVSYTLGGAR